MEIQYYKKESKYPIQNLLTGCRIKKNLMKQLLEQDFPDTGRSTGFHCLVIQGGMVEHPSFVPSPIAMSTVEAECNICAVDAMLLAHMRMKTK